MQVTVVVPVHWTPSPDQSWCMLPLLTTKIPFGPELLATVALRWLDADKAAR